MLINLVLKWKVKLTIYTVIVYKTNNSTLQTHDSMKGLIELNFYYYTYTIESDIMLIII